MTFTTVVDTAVNMSTIFWSANGLHIIIATITRDSIWPGYEDRVTLDRTSGSLELTDLAPWDGAKYKVSPFLKEGSPLGGETRLEVYGEYCCWSTSDPDLLNGFTIKLTFPSEVKSKTSVE